MGSLTVGSVVLIVFPYSNLTHKKLRPAVVVGRAEFNNVVVCQITSQSHASRTAIALKDSDFTQGALQKESFIRPDKLFTADQNLIVRSVGKLSKQKIAIVRERIIRMLES